MTEDEKNFNQAMSHLISGATLANAASVAMTVEGADYTMTIQLDKAVSEEIEND